MNENRNLFSFDGLTGMTIATLVLVVAVLSAAYVAYHVQTANANKYYYIKDQSKIDMVNTDNASQMVYQEKTESIEDFQKRYRADMESKK